MTSYFLTTDFTVPAATPAAAPLVQPVTLLDERLVSVRIVIVPGHGGLSGIAIDSGGTQRFPYVQGTWLTGDGETVDHAWNDEVQAAALTLRGYNTGLYPHTFRLRWHLESLRAVVPADIQSPQRGRGSGDPVAGPAGDLVVIAG